VFVDDVTRELDRSEGDLKILFPSAPSGSPPTSRSMRKNRQFAGEDPAPAPAPAAK
jgi:hypothetical protein